MPGAWSRLPTLQDHQPMLRFFLLGSMPTLSPHATALSPRVGSDAGRVPFGDDSCESS